MKARGAIGNQGVMPASLLRRWRFVHVGWTVFRGDRFCYVGIGRAEKRGFLPVEKDQIGMKVPSWYQHRFIRLKKPAAMSAQSPQADAGREEK